VDVFRMGNFIVGCDVRRCIKRLPDYFHRPQTDGTTWLCAMLESRKRQHSMF
jgi:hypothetical protein